jgi:hypothetical protein
MDGIDYRTTDNSRWGAGTGTGTGGNLTPLQADLNFWTLYGRLKDLEDNPPEPVNILGFTIIGSQFQVNMTDGSHLGPYSLPIATFRMVGEWVNSMPLQPLDIFTVEHDGVYITNIAHTTPASPATFDAAADDGSGNLLYTKVFGDDAYIYDFGFFYPGQPGLGVSDGAAIAGHVVCRPITLPAGLADCKGDLLVPPAADLSFPLTVNGSDVGTLDFASGETAATFTFTADVSMAAGDVFKVMKPATVDVAATELAVTFVAIRQFDTTIFGP